MSFNFQQKILLQYWLTFLYSNFRSGSSEVPQKVSPRAVRQLGTTTTLDTVSVTASKISKERSPKVADRKSPRSPVPEVTFFYH
jgi:hypothetical protein